MRPGTWPKFKDLLQHLWIPTMIIALEGTAGLIRVMRANLLDELHKPYYTTAKAKGLSEFQALIQYPVRVAQSLGLARWAGSCPAWFRARRSYRWC